MLLWYGDISLSADGEEERAGQERTRFLFMNVPAGGEKRQNVVFVRHVNSMCYGKTLYKDKRRKSWGTCFHCGPMM